MTEADGENAGTVGIYLCNFQWIMKLNNFEYVILLITKYIYIIPFSHSDYRICVARLTLKRHIIYLPICIPFFSIDGFYF